MSKVSLDPKIEKDLIEKSKKDPRAFGDLYSHYEKHIYRFVVLRVSSETVAEDITATIFRKALEGIENFRWQGVSFSSWLYRIARNSVIDYYRINSKRGNNTSISDIDLPSGEKGPEEIAIEKEFEEQIQELLDTLNPRDRKIVYMKFFEGYTNKTIAELLEITETNVGTILHRSIGKLREKI